MADLPRDIVQEVLSSGSVPAPPPDTQDDGERYPLAVDFDPGGELVAISYAEYDMHPNIERGWWCGVDVMRRSDVTVAWTSWGGLGHGCDGGDNTWTPRPFERPAVATNSTADWIDWGSVGGKMGWEEGFWAHTHFGIAPVGTARVTVTDESGAERDLQITPWCGAFVAIVRGEHSTLTGYDAAGAVLGTTG